MGNIYYDSSEISAVKRLWPGAIIPYEISDAFPKNDPNDQRRQAIQLAIDTINNDTNFKLVPKQNHRDYIVFTENTSSICQSKVGRKFFRQAVECDLDKTFNGTVDQMAGHVMHEIGHVIGLLHEHQRSDRNNFIKVTVPKNDPHRGNDFDIVGLKHSLYDFRSIMHYSIDGSDIIYIKGLLPGTKVSDVGNINALSYGDIAAINYIARQCLKNFIAVRVYGTIYGVDHELPPASNDTDSTSFDHTYILQKGRQVNIPNHTLCVDEVGIRAILGHIKIKNDGSLLFDGGAVELYEDKRSTCGGTDRDGIVSISPTTIKKGFSRSYNIQVDNNDPWEPTSKDFGIVNLTIDAGVNIGDLLARGHSVSLSSEAEELEELKEEVSVG